MPIAALLDLVNYSSQVIKHRSEYPTANVVDGSVFLIRLLLIVIQLDLRVWVWPPPGGWD